MCKISKFWGQKPRAILLSAMILTLLLSGCGGSSYGDDDKVTADTVAPIITLIGEAEVNFLLNGSYTDAGATANDNVDGAVSVVITGSVDTMKAGPYTLTFTATDYAGNVSTLTRTVTVVPPTLTGTAAAGAAIVGTVTIKDSLGVTISELIEADGTYSVDVTDLTPPFRLRAEGTVGGKTYKLHSYAEEATLDGTVNITPFTDLIIANAAHQIAEAFFDETSPTNLDPVELAAQEDALQAKLQAVFDALGLDSAINLLTTTFSADHSGLDAALDIIQIETDPTTHIATIQNILDGSSIEDDITDPDDNQSVIVVDTAALITAVSDTQAIAALFNSFTAVFSDGLPTSASIGDFFGETFLHEDQAKSQFLTDITTDPSIIGINFSSISVRDLDSTAGTATVDFNVSFHGIVEAEIETWQLQRNSELVWQFLGNQQFFEADLLSFHCNDFDGTDSTTGGCGLNVSFYDNDFTNNGTNDAPLASGTMTIIDGTDGETVKDIVYLGNPEFIGAGELQVYNQTSQMYQGDYADFGESAGEVDPTIFVVGDIIRYKLYTEQLDLTVPGQPMVSTGNEVAMFDKILMHLPETTGRYPALTAEALTAFDNFALDEDLTVSWTLQMGTVIDSIRVEISDNQGNYYDVEDESIAPDASSTTVDSSVFSQDLLNDLNFDQTNMTLLVRIYSIVPATGQTHSTDYRRNFDGTSEPGDGTANIMCNTESPWDDDNDKPTVFYSINDFEAAVADCANQAELPDFSKTNLEGLTWYVDDERIAFDSTASTFVITTYGDDGVLGNEDDETFYGTVADYATNVIELSFSFTPGGDIVGRDLIRVKGSEIFQGKTVYTAVILWEFYDWAESDGDKIDKAHQGGELHTGSYALDADFDWDAWDN
ncbi:DUF5011 domain-containing protein [Colwellia piezophila]|uniref:DUF5011 domain-containing protein n=1 Tax=Colwellia piezophila TaxID=211668 RepID=UPI00037E09AC|nr:DUF5011 domain-containing protein [Colwellia piezophila]